MGKPNSSQAKYRGLVIGLSVALIIAFFTCLCIGRYPVPIMDCVRILLSRLIDIPITWTRAMDNVIIILRLPRTIAAALIGAGMALSGAAYQSMFKNPLVSPDILGVSSGASIGACTAILLGLSGTLISFWAFLGGMVAVIITASMPKLMKSTSSMILVLSGVITGSLMGSILGIIRFLAAGSDNEEILKDITFWTMGSFTKASIEQLAKIAPVILISGAILLMFRYRLNVLSMGDQEAKSLGLNVARTQLVVIITATLITGASVSLCGTVGWVGLVVPHLSRMLVGPDNRKALPISILLGALSMIAIDTICRSITSAEIPVSIVTGIFGAPFYFYLLYKQRMSVQ